MSVVPFSAGWTIFFSSGSSVLSIFVGSIIFFFVLLSVRSDSQKYKKDLDVNKKYLGFFVVFGIIFGLPAGLLVGLGERSYGLIMNGIFLSSLSSTSFFFAHEILKQIKKIKDAA